MRTAPPIRCGQLFLARFLFNGRPVGSEYSELVLANPPKWSSGASLLRQRTRVSPSRPQNTTTSLSKTYLLLSPENSNHVVQPYPSFQETNPASSARRAQPEIQGAATRANSPRRAPPRSISAETIRRAWRSQRPQSRRHRHEAALPGRALLRGCFLTWAAEH
jgi:hypothetical protein